ncbi:MAG: glycine cleavage T C-terminal barrel domain-containing protein [Ilumatobacteraceae bacterium]
MIDRLASEWQVLIDAGAPHQLMACGYKAIDSLRLEKGYRAWGGEINSEANPWEAGLGFAVALGKEKFIGRDALVASQGKETTRLVALHFDDIRRVPLGNEPIRVGDDIVGRVKSGGQGFTIGKAIGYGYLPIQYAQPGTAIDVEFFGEWVSGVVT